MKAAAGPAPRCLQGKIVASREIAGDLLLLDLELPEPVDFLPGQFAMLNFTGVAALVFSRPLSILASEGCRVIFYYRVVGRGTALLAEAPLGSPVSFFGPLGNPFPPPAAAAVLLIAGGVGLPPLHAWWQCYGRDGDRAFFGARNGGEVPWPLLSAEWLVSVDRATGLPDGREAYTGLVVDCVRDSLPGIGAGPRQVLACGPLPMLRAVKDLAAELDWPCLVSVEEQMGCGYGVCRGCIVPAAAGGHLTACQDGPVFAADQIDWRRFAREEV